MARDGRTEHGGGREGGFTLAELLVVVSIICLMMSLMLPALTRAQRQGEQAHCLANQHQIEVIWHQLVAEEDGHIPDVSRPAGLRSDYYGHDVFRCKSVPEGAGSTSAGQCYGFSAILGGRGHDSVSPYLTLAAVPHPGDRLLLTDIDTRSTDMSFWPIISNRGQWKWRPWSDLFSTQNLTSRHNDGCNVTFVDGHGGYTRWKDARTLKFIKGIIADPNEASIDNPDLRYVTNILAGK